MSKIIEKIHRKFDTAGEKLLAEAKAIVATTIVTNISKTERLKNIGFTAGKPIKDAEEMFKKQESAKEMIEAIEYYKTYYPSYKFISEEQIQKICKKYKLLYGESDKYIGDIPEKNLAEIEAFKLREEDYYEESSLSFFWRAYSNQIMNQIDILRGDVVSTGILPVIREGSAKVNDDESPIKTKPQFKICAPKKDFNTEGHRIKDDWKLLDDPIVIQPVKYKNIVGGLIVSKWGLEGQDESLTNEINN